MRIEQKGTELILYFDPRDRVLGVVRMLPSRRFDGGTNAWHVPHTKENWAYMRKHPEIFPLDGISEPTSSGYAITAEKGLLRIKVPYSPGNTELLRRLPNYRMWEEKERVWFAKPTRLNLEHLKRAFTQATWDVQAESWYQEHVVAVKQRAEQFRQEKQTIKALASIVSDYKYGGPAPWAHQTRAFLLSRDRKAFALFMEQRTGKTKVLIDTACWQYIQGHIRQVLVVAPNSVKTNWVTDEIPAHMPEYIPYVAACWYASPSRAERDALDQVLMAEQPDKMPWFVMNVEAFSTPKGRAIASAYVKHVPTLMIVDESSRIKTPGAQRTRAIIAIGKHAELRRIATGTPATQGPLDTYSQGQFLDPEILGFGSFYAFRNHFAIMGGWNGKEVVGYANLEELQHLWDAHSFRVTRDECFDLPPKGYQRLVVDMTAEQSRLYKAMRERMVAQLGTERVTASIVLTQMTRLAQIAGGFATIDRMDYSEGDYDNQWDRMHEVRAVPGGNPKIAALLEIVGDVQGKVLVWARFRAEVAAAADALRREYGPESIVEFHGGIGEDDRVKARTAFQDPSSSVRFLVGQTETGGMGINLDQGRTIVYISNSFSLESRLQSEDRPMSAAQKHSVAVIDIVARGTVDEQVVQALRDKRDIALQVTGDAWKQWI